MSATLPSSTRRRVSMPHKVAIVISVAYALFSIVFSVPAINDGESGNNSGVPWGVLIVGFVIAVVVCVAAYGAWMGQRWGVVLTIVMNALSFIIGVPGIFFAGRAVLVVSSIIGCIANLVVIGLLLRRGRTTAPAPSQGVAA